MPVWTLNTKSTILPTGQTHITGDGAKSIDVLYYGTVDAVTVIGSDPDSDAVPVPPNIPYTLEFNNQGYKPVTIINNGDADVYIMEKR